MLTMLGCKTKAGKKIKVTKTRTKTVIEINEETKEQEEKEIEEEYEEEEDEEEEQDIKMVKTSVLFMKGMKCLQEALLRIEALEEEVDKLKKK